MPTARGFELIDTLDGFFNKLHVGTAEPGSRAAGGGASLLANGRVRRQRFEDYDALMRFAAKPEPLRGCTSIEMMVTLAGDWRWRTWQQHAVPDDDDSDLGPAMPQTDPRRQQRPAGFPSWNSTTQNGASAAREAGCGIDFANRTPGVHIEAIRRLRNRTVLAALREEERRTIPCRCGRSANRFCCTVPWTRGVRRSRELKAATALLRAAAASTA